MKTRTYQIALAAAVAVCVVLGGALAYVLLHHSLSATTRGCAGRSGDCAWTSGIGPACAAKLRARGRPEPRWLRFNSRRSGCRRSA